MTVPRLGTSALRSVGMAESRTGRQARGKRYTILRCLLFLED
jgi:hypothetical protein